MLQLSSLAMRFAQAGDFMYTNTTDYTMDQTIAPTQEDAIVAAGFVLSVMLFWSIVVLAILAITTISQWKIFEKAGKPGWAALIPIYSTIVWLEIIGKPITWLLLLFVPFVNVVITFLMVIELAKAFGKDTVYGIFMIFLPIIAYPMLAFGKDTYKGPAGNSAAVTSMAPSAPTAQSPVGSPQAAVPQYAAPQPQPVAPQPQPVAPQPQPGQDISGPSAPPQNPSA